jgi:hypothetical protein
MRDFTAETFQLLLSSIKSAGYTFMTVASYLRDPVTSTVILRHDVDAKPGNALACAELENRLGISGTYYFRAGPGSYDKAMIREISRLGHEIGYHYEDLAVAKGDYEKAIILFAENLAKLRRVVPIETICMHGSPLSKYDNRKLWEKYDYRKFGISGEPYLDIGYDMVHYLTDTGRCWDGERFNLRDKVKPGQRLSSREKVPQENYFKAVVESMHSTFDIITTLKKNLLPSVMLITIHPQRWNSRLMPWITELVLQNGKNVVKSIINRAGRS